MKKSIVLISTAMILIASTAWAGMCKSKVMTSLD